MNSRRVLIVAHDLFMTAAAIVASFYIRFEAAGLAERQDGLFLFLPGFVAYAGVVYLLFHLYEAKWRFASLPDLMNIVRASTVLAVSLLVLDYVLVAPNVLGQFFFGKITILLYWILQMVFLGAGRIGYRYFRYARARHHARADATNPTLLLGRAADAEVLLRAIESGAVKKTCRSAFCRRRRPTRVRASAAFPCSVASTRSIASSTTWRSAARRLPG